MPFDFERYDTKCSAMTLHELQHEWEHYTRLISSAATSTSISGIALPFTAGISGIGIALSAPAIHNARKKREIIDRHLTRLGGAHDTRKRDVLTPMAFSGTVGMLTMGIGHAGGGAISNAAMEHGWAAVAAHEGTVNVSTHLAVHGVAMAGEEEHMKNKKEKEALRNPRPLSPSPSMADLTKIQTEPADSTQTATIMPAACQSVTTMGAKPAMLEIPAFGLSQSVPSTPMDPAPAYTLYASAAQTGYFPPVKGEKDLVHVTELEYQPPDDHPMLPPRGPMLLPEKSKQKDVDEAKLSIEDEPLPKYEKLIA